MVEKRVSDQGVVLLRQSRTERRLSRRREMIQRERQKRISEAQEEASKLNFDEFRDFFNRQPDFIKETLMTPEELEQTEEFKKFKAQQAQIKSQQQTLKEEREKQRDFDFAVKLFRKAQQGKNPFLSQQKPRVQQVFKALQSQQDIERFRSSELGESKSKAQQIESSISAIRGRIETGGKLGTIISGVGAIKKSLEPKTTVKITPIPQTRIEAVGSPSLTRRATTVRTQEIPRTVITPTGVFEEFKTGERVLKVEAGEEFQRRVAETKGKPGEKKFTSAVQFGDGLFKDVIFTAKEGRIIKTEIPEGRFIPIIGPDIRSPGQQVRAVRGRELRKRAVTLPRDITVVRAEELPSDVSLTQISEDLVVPTAQLELAKIAEKSGLRFILTEKEAEQIKVFGIGRTGLTESQRKLFTILPEGIDPQLAEEIKQFAPDIQRPSRASLVLAGVQDFFEEQIKADPLLKFIPIEKISEKNIKRQQNLLKKELELSKDIEKGKKGFSIVGSFFDVSEKGFQKVKGFIPKEVTAKVPIIIGPGGTVDVTIPTLRDVKVSKDIANTIRRTSDVLIKSALFSPFFETGTAKKAGKEKAKPKKKEGTKQIQKKITSKDVEEFLKTRERTFAKRLSREKFREAVQRFGAKSKQVKELEKILKNVFGEEGKIIAKDVLQQEGFIAETPLGGNIFGDITPESPFTTIGTPGGIGDLGELGKIPTGVLEKAPEIVTLSSLFRELEKTPTGEVKLTAFASITGPSLFEEPKITEVPREITKSTDGIGIKEDIDVLPKERTAEGTKTEQIVSPIQTPVEEQLPRTDQITRQALQTSQVLKTDQLLQQVQKEVFQFGSRDFQLRTPKFKAGILPSFRKKKKKKKKGKAVKSYNVFGKVIKTGRFAKLNKVPLTKLDAKSLGSFLVDKSLSTNFKIKGVNKNPQTPKVKFPKNYYGAVQGKFRDFRIKKGKKIKLDNMWIEKKGKPRLDTRDEINKITLLKKLAQITKPKKKRKRRKKTKR